MILILLLVHATGWVLIGITAATGVINGVTILGAALIIGTAATINHLNTEKQP